MHKLLPFALLALAGNLLAAERTPPELRLGDLASPRAYEATVAIDPREPTFGGEIRIEMRIARATPVVWMNATQLEIASAEFRQGERRIATRVVPGNADIVGFEAVGEPFVPGDATATIRYRGRLEPVATHGLFRQQEGGEWYVVSQFESLSARRAWPCFDEPSWKVPWQVTIDAPAANEVVSNTPEAVLSDTPDRPGWKRHRFGATKPLPTYLVALAVGPFDVVNGGTAGLNHTPLRYYAPKGRGAEMRFVKESTPRLLEILESYFGTPFPFEKLDTVTIPATVGFGAMENVGMITYASDILLARSFEESMPFKRRYASIGAHEIAHQWFGDLVTMAWWDDVWLNEAFATWMARKAVLQYHPDWENGWRKGERRRRALTSDRLASARRVHNPVVERNDVYSAFDGITYDKGAEVLAMFEAWLGADRFRNGVRDYLARHAYGNASARDFFGAIAAASDRPQSAIAAFEAFIEQPGLPLMEVALKCEREESSLSKGASPGASAGSRGPSVALEVSQQRFRLPGAAPSDLQWTTPACFHYMAGGTLETQCEEIGNARRVIAFRNADRCPDWVVANADGTGHYIARFEPFLMRRVRENISDLPENDATALGFDTSLLVGAGLISMDDALATAAALLHHPSPGGKHAGVYLLEKQRDEFLSPAQLKVKREMLADLVQPLALAVGWVPRKDEPDAMSDLRVLLLPWAARETGGEALRLEARALALHWIDSHESVAAEVVPAILETAARYADEPTFSRMGKALLGSKERRDRTQLLKVIGKVRDARLRERVFAMTLRKEGGVDALDGRDAYALMDEALDDDWNRLAAFEYLRANWDALVAKFPPESAMRLTTALQPLCTPEARTSFAAFFKDRAPKFPGGPLKYRQVLESIDICIAAH